MGDTPSVVAAGETMVLATPRQPGRLRHAGELEFKIGGAESNLAIALSRLGVHSGWASRLGDDEPGQLVLDKIRGEGVDTSRVRRVPEAPTGLYLRERVGREARVYYYRENSAASMMVADDDLDADYFAEADFVHLTGITPALSESCRTFVRALVRKLEKTPARLSFDVNYRSKLWAAGEALEFVEEVLPAVDLLFVSGEEARAMWGRDDEGLLRELGELGAEEVVLKRGKEGSVALVGGEIFEQPGFEVAEVDPIGAGDAFAAGYLAGLLWENPPEERLRIANAMGAYSVMTLGDYEGLPDRDELEAFLEGRESLGR
ncbi:MAG: sugar kinase [Rubrobacter sp.]|jgi:2-dehydro-3-deoxygluconokinase|nr:sugar kinase [Rubrobacter sp.]